MWKPLRTPSQGTTVLGIDPGFSKLGAGVLYQAEPQASIVPVAVSYCETKPDTKKQKNLRVNVDDSRRLREIWDWLVALNATHRPNGIGVEAYSPGRPVGDRPQGPANKAWKASMGYSLVYALAWGNGIPIFTFIPQDVKRAFHLKGGTSKQDVAKTLSYKWPVLPGLIDGRAKKQHEHLYDGVALAHLAFEEIYKMRALMGV